MRNDPQDDSAGPFSAAVESSGSIHAAFRFLGSCSPRPVPQRWTLWIQENAKEIVGHYFRVVMGAFRVKS